MNVRVCVCECEGGAYECEGGCVYVNVRVCVCECTCT